ncbi:MAG TPA: hypothetical protein VK525_07305 [Candidatus Saccharimonadales bacterium]|nr:hypothetical protein [Candidatus Saccharimonadales bacterium]
MGNVRNYRLAVILGALVLSCGAVSGQVNSQPGTVLRGWLSDELCARGRAEDGTYTATNLACAKECVAAGKKIVLIDPDNKRVLTIENQDAARRNVGDYVEIAGAIDPATAMLHVDSLKFLDKNRAMCGVPAKSKKKTN